MLITVVYRVVRLSIVDNVMIGGGGGGRLISVRVRRVCRARTMGVQYCVVMAVTVV